VRNFTSTLRKRERGMSLSRATTPISYGHGFVDHQATTTTRGGVLVGFCRARASDPDRASSGVPSIRNGLAELYGTSMGLSGHQ
jgi:hypothetical protein